MGLTSIFKVASQNPAVLFCTDVWKFFIGICEEG